MDSEIDRLAMAMINAERERYLLEPLPLSALSDRQYDRVKGYARVAAEEIKRLKRSVSELTGYLVSLGYDRAGGVRMKDV